MPLRYIEQNERLVGAGHPVYPDTLNRALKDLVTQSGDDPAAASYVPAALDRLPLASDGELAAMGLTPLFTGGVAKALRLDRLMFWVLRFFGIYTPIDPKFGAWGNGVTDDTVAIQACADAAGSYRTVFFPPGTSYRVAARLTPLAYQRWIGYGAKLIRANQITDTTSTPIVAGTPITMKVDHPERWRVGRDVALYDAANPQSNYDPANHRITAIAGDMVTLATLPTVNFPAGCSIASSHLLIGTGVNVPGVQILGFEFDGNRANNPTVQRWELQGAVYITSDRGLLRDLYVHDEQADGIQIGGMGVRFENLHVEDCQGNGVHMSNASQWQGRNLRILRVNKGGAGVGHADGGFILSNLCGDGQLDSLYVEDAIACLGSIDSDDNSELTFSNIVGKDCTYAVDGLSDDLRQGKVVITGGRFIRCGQLALRNTKTVPTPTEGPYRWQFSNIYLEDTITHLRRCRGVSFSNVEFYYPSDTVKQLVRVEDCEDIAFDPTCRFIGGAYGVYVVGSATKNVEVFGTFINQWTTAARLHTAGMVNATFRGRIRNEAGKFDPANYVPVVLANGARCIGAEIDVVGGKHGIECPNGDVNVTGAIVRNCLIRTPVGMPSVRIYGGAQNNYVCDNGYTIAPANGQVDKNIVERNFKLDTAAAIDAPAIAPTYRGKERGWQQLGNVPSAQTKVPLTDVLCGTLGRVMSRNGSVTALFFVLKDACTLGMIHVRVQKSTDDGATWADIGDGKCETWINAGQQPRSVTQFAKGLYTFNRYDRLRITVTSTNSPAFAPTVNDLYAGIDTLEE